MKVLALALALWTACSKEAMPIDGVAVRIIGHRAALGRVVVDDQRQSWFIVQPLYRGNAAVLCRMRDAALTCGTIPGSEAREPSESTTYLLDAGAGATPLVALPIDRDRAGARYLEPFTWREVTRFAGASFERPAIVFSDGTLVIARASRELAIVRAGHPPRMQVLGNNVHGLQLSPFGALWTEEETGRLPRLMSAPLGPDGSGTPREVLRDELAPAAATCRDGNTAGFLVARTPPQLVMVDLATGTHVAGDAEASFDLVCRRGQVAGLALLGKGRSALCTAAGCASTATGHDELERQVMLVDGSLLVVATADRPGHLITGRVDQQPRTLRIGGSRLFSMPQARAVPEGAIVLYADGSLVAFDHQGAPRELALHWSGPAAASAATAVFD